MYMEPKRAGHFNHPICIRLRASKLIVIYESRPALTYMAVYLNSLLGVVTI